MKTWIKIIIALGIISIIAAVAVYKFVINKPHTDFVAAKTELVVRAKRLYTDYSANPETANGKFLDKVLEIEGSISRVELADSLVILVYVFEEGDFGDQGVRITMLPEYNQEAKTLSSLKPIKVKGVCRGFNDTDVIIEKGSLVKEEN